MRTSAVARSVTRPGVAQPIPPSIVARRVKNGRREGGGWSSFGSDGPLAARVTKIRRARGRQVKSGPLDGLRRGNGRCFCGRNGTSRSMAYGSWRRMRHLGHQVRRRLLTAAIHGHVVPAFRVRRNGKCQHVKHQPERSARRQEASIWSGKPHTRISCDWPRTRISPH